MNTPLSWLRDVFFAEHRSPKKGTVPKGSVPFVGARLISPRGSIDSNRLRASFDLIHWNDSKHWRRISMEAENLMNGTKTIKPKQILHMPSGVSGR